LLVLIFALYMALGLAWVLLRRWRRSVASGRAAMVAVDR
jgi:hypothetical protein